MGKRACLAYLGPLGRILCGGPSFFASKEFERFEQLRRIPELGGAIRDKLQQHSGHNPPELLS